MTYEAIREQSAVDLLRYTVNEKGIENLVVHYGGLRNLSEATLDELLGLGLTKAKATRLMAVLQLARLYSTEPLKRSVISHPSHAYDLLRDLERSDVEVFKVISLNAKNVVLSIHHVSTGTVDATYAHPRDVFKQAIVRSAVSVICAHCHPGSIGTVEPSPQDIDLTQRLVKAGELIGIRVLDHIIVGKGCYASLKERQEM